MSEEFYCSYRIVLHLLCLIGAGYLTFRCTHTITRILTVLAGCMLIGFNEPIAAFLYPILQALVMMLVVVFVITLLIVFISGHTAGSVFQRFNIFRN